MGRRQAGQPEQQAGNGEAFHGFKQFQASKYFWRKTKIGFGTSDG
jgi:hypothetical protein